MRKFVISIIVLLSFSITAFGQDQDGAGLTRRQGRQQLDNAKGFGDFVFGSPIKLFKKFMLKLYPEDNSKRYFLKTPMIYEGIKIDSAYLGFSNNKLYSITMYTDKSNAEKLLAYCMKKFGPVSHDYDPGMSLWRGRKKTLSFNEIKDSVIEVHFVDMSVMSDVDMADTIPR